jgi:hypothetical protein
MENLNLFSYQDFIEYRVFSFIKKELFPICFSWEFLSKELSLPCVEVEVATINLAKEGKLNFSKEGVSLNPPYFNETFIPFSLGKKRTN